MASAESPLSRPQRPEPELDTVPLAKMTRKTIERLAPFCQLRLPPENPIVPLVPKTNGKILGLIHAVDTTMLVAQIGYRLASDAATLCDPFAPSTQPTPGTHRLPGLSTPEALQTMAAHGHGHCLKANETFQNVQQEIFKIAATTKDNEIVVLVPPDPQQPATRRITLKEVGTDLVANLNLLNQFSRSMLDLVSWWEWLEEELLSPNSTLLPSAENRDAELYARWSKIKGGYLDYYNTIRVVYTRYPQLLTTSSTAWQSISSVPPPPSSPGSSWDGSFQDLGAAFDEAVGEEAKSSSRDKLNDEEKTKKKAKSVKSVKSVKAFVGKIGFVKVFSRKKGEKEKKTKEKEVKKENGVEKKTDETPVVDVSRTPEQAEPTQPPVQPSAPEAPKAKEVASQTEPQPSNEVIQPEKTPQGDHEHPTARGSDSSSSSSNAKSKSSVAKVLDALKNVFAKLGCQGSAKMEN